MDPSQTIRVLLIDDDQGDFVMTRGMIGQIERTSVALDWVPTFQEGLEALKADRHDVYLVDYFLEDRDGLELVRQAREFGTRKPIIMLTGRGTDDVHVEAMRAGASDYLVKGRVDADQLERTIRYALGRGRADEALRDGAQHFRTIFEASRLAILLVDLQGLVIEASPAFRRAFGYGDKEPRGRPLTELVPPEERAAVASEQESLAAGTSRVETERRFLSADGALLSARSLATVVTDADGRPDHVMILLEDLAGVIEGAPF